jgi:hypothetical protein
VKADGLVKTLVETLVDGLVKLFQSGVPREGSLPGNMKPGLIILRMADPAICVAASSTFTAIADGQLQDVARLGTKAVGDDEDEYCC